MSQYQDLIIPEIEIHEIGKLITPKPERKNFSKESSVQESDSVATKVIPKIIPLPEPQVLGEDIEHSVNLKTLITEILAKSIRKYKSNSCMTN